MINSKKIAMLLTCALLGAAVFADCGKTKRKRPLRLRRALRRQRKRNRQNLQRVPTWLM